MSSHPNPTRVPARSSLCRRLVVLLVTALTAATVVVATPLAATPVAAVTTAATPHEVAGTFLSLINQGRAAAGLSGYRAWDRLDALASERAGRMAAANDLSHTTAGGNIGSALDGRAIPWMGYGEIIGASSFAWGEQAAANIYGLWKNSPPHRDIMFSPGYNYVGIGVVRADDGSTWVSAVMTESADHTAPVARNGSIRIRSRDDIVLTWSAADPRLQTHTAGIWSYDVRMRRDKGAWKTVRGGTRATSLVLKDRWHRHWFSFQVRARDARGNLSAWTSEIRIWVR